MRARHARSFVLFCIAAVSIASHCATPPVTKDIDIEDDDRLTPSARVSYEILPGVRTRRRGSLLDLVANRAPIQGARSDGESVEKVEFTLRVGGEFAMVDGQDDVDVPAGRNVQLGVEIPGPTVVRGDVDNYRGHLTARPGVRFLDIISFEGMLGVGVDHTELRLRAPGFDLRHEQTNPAFACGARLSVRPIPLLDLYGQWTLMAGRFVAVGLEAGGQLNLTQNLGVYGGYMYRSYGKNSFQGSGSDLDVDFSGPTFGANLAF